MTNASESVKIVSIQTAQVSEAAMRLHSFVYRDDRMISLHTGPQRLVGPGVAFKITDLMCTMQLAQLSHQHPPPLECAMRSPLEHPPGSYSQASIADNGAV